MNATIDALMYGAGQLFRVPVLLAIGGAGFELHAARRANPQLAVGELVAIALERLEVSHIATRVAPMLGLVASMIPMGPALEALADGQRADASRNLLVPFSAVILALIAALPLAMARNLRAVSPTLWQERFPRACWDPPRVWPPAFSYRYPGNVSVIATSTRGRNRSRRNGSPDAGCESAKFPTVFQVPLPRSTQPD